MGRLSNEEKARRANGAPPTAGGAVAEKPRVNLQVQQMTGHQSEEEMVASLPTDTAAPVEGESETPTRKRRKKRTISPVATDVDPLANDVIYQRAIRKSTFMGAPKGVKGAFKVASKITSKPSIALDHNEEEDVDDYFYALSKRRAVFDPFETWWTSLLYFIVMMATLIGTRFAQAQGEGMQKAIAEWFGYSKKDAEEVKQEGE